jgi:glycosyl-4,4'-diaponeurosporenoate acyltransferase
MPLVDISTGWAVVIDCIVWTVVGFGTGYVAHRWPTERLATDGWITRLRSFEREGRWYDSAWRIRRWKDSLPEGGAFFGGGFSKRSLPGRDDAHLGRFVIETRRAELTHWVVMAFGPVFFLWNPWWLALVMMTYGIVANLPCILVQRYNRGRLERVLARRRRREHTGP